MKKAKEYATEIIETYINEDTKAALILAVKVSKDLFAEYDELCKTRRVTQYGSMLSLLKEQHIKWVSICRNVNKQVNILDERGFLNIIENKMTMIYPNLMQIIN